MAYCNGGLGLLSQSSQHLDLLCVNTIPFSLESDLGNGCNSHVLALTGPVACNWPFARSPPASLGLLICFVCQNSWVHAAALLRRVGAHYSACTSSTLSFQHPTRSWLECLYRQFFFTILPRRALSERRKAPHKAISTFSQHLDLFPFPSTILLHSICFIETQRT